MQAPRACDPAFHRGWTVRLILRSAKPEMASLQLAVCGKGPRKVLGSLQLFSQGVRRMPGCTPYSPALVSASSDERRLCGFTGNVRCSRTVSEFQERCHPRAVTLFPLIISAFSGCRPCPSPRAYDTHTCHSLGPVHRLSTLTVILPPLLHQESSQHFFLLSAFLLSASLGPSTGQP